MIEELRIYRIHAGGLGEYLRLAAEVQMPIRSDRFGLLLGFWHAEIGAAHSVVNLWRHQGLDHRQGLRAELDSLEAWRTEYLPHVWPLMDKQVIRIGEPVVAFDAPSGSNFYEVRFIRTRVGEARRFAGLLMDEAPAPFRQSTAGLSLTMMGQLNEVVHIGAYKDLGERARHALTHPDWQGFLDRHGDKIAKISSSLLLPAPHSPAQ